MPDRPKVGEILIQAGVIDRLQLQSALGQQTRWGHRLGVALVNLGFIEEHVLVRALASQLDLPVARLEGKRIAPEILALVPRELAEEHMVVPLFIKEEAGVYTLLLGMEDPCNIDVLDDLSFRTGMDVRPVMVGPSEIAEAIDRHYHRSADMTGSDEAPVALPIEDAGSPSAPLSPQEVGESTAPIAEQPGARITSGTEALARHWAMWTDEEGDTTQPEQSLSAIELETPSVSPAAGDQPTGMPTPIEALAPLHEGDTAPASVSPEPPLLERPEPSMKAGPTPTNASENLATGDARTRLILHALTQILIEKGVMTASELQTRVRALGTTRNERE
jgi:type IV pilus assembly protein PilB